jgi:PAS domain S-box-containing protein
MGWTGEYPSMAMGFKAKKWWSAPPVVLRYGVTLLSVALAVILAWVMWHFWQSEAFASLFFCAVMFSAWFGGYRQGLLAVTASALAFDYYLLSPQHSFYIEPSEQPRFIIFVVSALIIGFVTASQRRNAESFRRARDELASNVNELERTNVALHAENVERKQAEEALRRGEGIFGRGTATQPHRQLRLDCFHWRDPLVRGNLSHLPIRANGIETIYRSCSPTGSSGRPGLRETDHRTYASQDGKDFDFEHRLLMPDGSVKHLHVVAHAEKDKSAIEFVGAVMDVTVAKEAEDKIRLIINTVPGLLWTARPDGWVDFLNQRWLDYTGMTLEQGLGWAWQPGYHPDDLGNLLSKWRAAVAERKPLEVEARLRRFDGEYRWFLKRAFPLFDNAGRVLGWYGGNIDIHDLKQAEEKLRRIETYLAEGAEAE